MPPGSNKRKRPERRTSQDNGPGRPSPYRPEDRGLAQHDQQHGGSRGGRGGGGSRRPSRQNAQSPVSGYNAMPVTPRNLASPAPALPQQVQSQRDSPAVDGSRTATPVPAAVDMNQSSVDEGSKPASAPYLYEYLTDEVVDAWQESGKSSMSDMARDTDEGTIGAVLQELVRSALDNRLDATEAGAAVRGIAAQYSDPDKLDVEFLFLNTISLLDDADMKKSSLLTLVSATGIDPDRIRQELDIPLLSAISLVRSSFMQMRTRKSTNILYRQANYNLLREETEGYAKLITEYFNTANESTGNDNVSAEAAFQRIKALVGSFDLDVGRVLDITLDISANLLVRAYRFIVRFYRRSSWWPESGVLDNVKWQDQGFDSFPPWALPGIGDDLDYSDEKEERLREEKRQLVALKGSRDVDFWQRAKEIGMDAFFELGSRRIVDFDSVLSLLETEVPPQYDAKKQELNADRRKRINENRRYMRETGTLPPVGNSDAAQLLGFKLRFYASPARDAQDTLPENLMYLAALLIKIGFISLRDLYPHLYPTDDKMSEEKARLEKEKTEKESKDKPGVGANALAMAGALTDDALPVVRNLRDKDKSGANTPKQEKKDNESASELPTPTNQKILILKALLVIGALPEALFILGKFPWIVDVDTSIPPYLHRIANQMLSKAAGMVQPLADRDDLQNSREDYNELAPVQDGIVPLKPRETKKFTRWLGLDTVEKTDGLTYRHYFPDWDENIPICQNVEDVVIVCNTFLGFLGVKIGQDVTLLSTLIRIAKHDLTENSSQPNRTRWLDLMRRLLVPALSLSKHNVGLTQEVYELLMLFPTTTRYNIYREWFLGKTSRLPDMRIAFDHNRAEVKDVLRRVTNETSKKQARALAKITYSSPGVVMINMIGQLEAYSNMIPSLVECIRFFSPLAYDVLTWCLINSLSGQGRDRMQADGMLTSSWLQALSQFVASLFHKYTALDPAPVLQYLASELRMGNSTDLEMFEQLLAELGGIRSDIEFNDAQVLAMAGGEHLQAQVVAQLADKRYERKKGPAQRLIHALEGPGLIGQTLIAIAQERQMYPHHELSKNMPLKVLGTNLDKIQQVFAQYLEVLRTNLKPADFDAAVPDVVSLVSNFGLEPGVAFMICRSGIAQRISESDANRRPEVGAKKRTTSQADVNGDLEMQDKSLTNGDHPMRDLTTVDIGATQEPPAVDDSKMSLTPQASGPNAADGERQSWHVVLEPIISGLQDLCSQIAEQVSVPFFVTFWTLSLQDILVHTESYHHEVDKLRNRIKEITADRSDMTARGVKDRDDKRKRLIEIQDKLREEVKNRVFLYQQTRNRMSREEKNHWFERSWERSDLDQRHAGLLQECFLPRAILSSLDAHYSFLLMKQMHDMGTPGFSIMHIMNQLMKKHELAAIIFQCTAMEAQHFGRFLCETLKLLQHWHADKVNYDKEALGSEIKEKQKLLGFAKTLKPNGDPEIIIAYEAYRRLLYNWHTFLNGALHLCFESGEYMHIRNGIIVLKGVVQVFPSLNFHGHNLVKLVAKISQEDPRQDIKLAAMSLLGPLRNREKQWLMPQAFRLNDAAKETGKAGSRAPSARPETPQPAHGTPKLSATALEFKPAARVQVNGTTRKESVAGREDGEIEDENKTRAAHQDETMEDAPNVKPEVKSAVADDEKAAIRPSAQTVSGVASTPATAAEKSIERMQTPKPVSKPPTPAPVLQKPPPPASEQTRPDSSRPPSTQPGPPHSLPSRPESRPFQGKPLPGPPSADRNNTRYPPLSEERYGRLDRPSDVRPGSRNHSPGRSRARTPERDPYHSSSAVARGPPRDDRSAARAPADARDMRNEAWHATRRELPSQTASHGRPPYDSRDRPNGSMGPPTNQTTHLDRSVNVNTKSADSQQNTRPPLNTAKSNEPLASDSGHRENPGRLALITEIENRNSLQGPERDSSSQRDQSRERSATEQRSAQVPGFIDGRAVAAEHPSPRDPQRPSDQPLELAPTGPRRNRTSRDLNASQESSYGRLNGSQDLPTPVRPPNGPSGRSTRNFTAPQALPNVRLNEPPLPSSSTTRPHEPSAPSSGSPSRDGSDRRSSGTHLEFQGSSNSVPTAPATESGPAVHPSRLDRIGDQPGPIQTNIPTDGLRNAGSPTSAPPSGPRGSNRPPVGTPTGPSPVIGAPPSGPASTVERLRRGDRQRASINATLQGTSNAAAPNGQSVSFRGAAQNRQGGDLVSSAAVVAPPVQAIASSMDPPARRTEAVVAPNQEPLGARSVPRGDLFGQDRGEGKETKSSSRAGGREDLDRQRNTRNDHSSGAEAFNRPFPNNQGPVDQRNDTRRPRNERELREAPPRDIRADTRPPRNESGPPRRPPPQGPPATFQGQPPAAQWDRANERRRDGPDDGRHGGRGGRGDDFRGGRRDDERRPPREENIVPPGGRKRRHEEPQPPPFEESKRRRSGR